MQIAPPTPQVNAASMRMPESKEVGPDRDGDKDDKGVAALASSLAKGVGTKVDIAA